MRQNEACQWFVVDRLIGVGICGSGAGELIAEATLAMEMGATAEDSHPLPYPEAALGNPFAAFAFTVLAFANPKAEIGLAKASKWLALATKWLAIVGNGLAKASNGLTQLAKGLAKASFWFAYPVFIDILALFVILNASVNT